MNESATEIPRYCPTVASSLATEEHVDLRLSQHANTCQLVARVDELRLTIARWSGAMVLALALLTIVVAWAGVTLRAVVREEVESARQRGALSVPSAPRAGFLSVVPEARAEPAPR